MLVGISPLLLKNVFLSLRNKNKFIYTIIDAHLIYFLLYYTQNIFSVNNKQHELRPQVRQLILQENPSFLAQLKRIYK